MLCDIEPGDTGSVVEVSRRIADELANRVVACPDLVCPCLSPRFLSGMNTLIKIKCNSWTSAMDVLEFFAGITTSQTDHPTFRDAETQLPAVRVSTEARTLLQDVLEACKYPIGTCPTRFIELA